MSTVTHDLLERELRDLGFVLADAPGRAQGLPPVVVGRAKERLTAGPIEIDLRARVVTVRGRAVGLSQKEWALLVQLAGDPERVFTREELLRDVWNYQATARTRTVDVYASRLRRKLRDADAASIFVENKWGVGYRLLAPLVKTT